MDEFIRDRIHQFEQDHKGLTISKHAVCIKDESEREPSAPIYTDDEAVGIIGDIVFCLGKIMKPHSRLRSSYGLKHEVEEHKEYSKCRVRQGKYGRPYVANGYFIIAALVYGIPYRKNIVRRCVPNMPFKAMCFNSYKLPKRIKEENDAKARYEANIWRFKKALIQKHTELNQDCIRAIGHFLIGYCGYIGFHASNHSSIVRYNPY